VIASVAWKTSINHLAGGTAVISLGRLCGSSNAHGYGLTRLLRGC
jgi:hypothetical protein